MGSARRDWLWAARNMAPESEGNLRLEIGHVLFIDRKKRVIAYYRDFVRCYLAGGVTSLVSPCISIAPAMLDRYLAA